MNRTIDQLLNLIKLHPTFLQLQSVIENSQGWHDNEIVYDHCLKTAEIAKKEREGLFIKNPKVKQLFDKWLNEDVAGIQKRDLVVIIALLHDCGKILHFKENNIKGTLLSKLPTTTNEFYNPGHEYWGAKLVVLNILGDLSLPEEVITYCSEVIEYHDSFSSNYFQTKLTWNIPELLSDVKSRAGGFYKEDLFNMYCDGYTAPAFEIGKKKIEALFNNNDLYIKRKYFIMQ